METFNLFEPTWDGENAHGSFRHRQALVDEHVGAERLAANLYELPAGAKSWPYHYELTAEEWLLVVSGSPTVRTAAGRRQLRAGDVVCFRAGASGAHQVINDDDEPARILLISNRADVSVVRFPDTAKIGVSATDEPLLLLADNPELDYWQDES